jgi:enoyl-CoA hydratase/carnithine racemase
VALGEKIAANGPLAVAAALAAVMQGQDMPLATGLLYESTLFGMLGATDDMHEGLKAFLEKRKPNFRGR